VSRKRSGATSIVHARPVIRPARADDLDALVDGNLALAEESERLTLNGETLRQGIRALLESRAPGRYWVAELGGRVVGQLLITFEWSDWRNRMVWWIQSVYVSPDVRRVGIFRALFEYVREEAQRAGSGGLRLYVDTSNTSAQSVYKALGMNGDHYQVFEDMFTGDIVTSDEAAGS